MIKLYDYYRSSSSYRVRIALELKGLPYESVHIDLLSGEQKAQPYKDVNPQGMVPTFVDGDVQISQSMAIMEYLDEVYVEPALVYGDAQQKAQIRALSYIIACEVAPLNIPKIWKGYMGMGPEQGQEWMGHWMHEGFSAYEETVQNIGAAFSCGDVPSMADLCLIPQLYNARRFKVPLENYPKICEIEKRCLALEVFQKASPESHPSAPADLEVIHGPFSPVLKEAA